LKFMMLMIVICSEPKAFRNGQAVITLGRRPFRRK
jgi:hypothetical protein